MSGDAVRDERNGRDVFAMYAESDSTHDGFLIRYERREGADRSGDRARAEAMRGAPLHFAPVEMRGSTQRYGWVVAESSTQ